MSDIAPSHDTGESFDAGDDGPVEVTPEEQERLTAAALARWEAAVERHRRANGGQ